MISLFTVIDILLNFLEDMMAFYGIFSLLLFFGVLNPYGRIVSAIWQVLQGIFDPLLARIRKYIPPFRGFDWSFLVLYLLIVFIRLLLREYGPLAAHTVQAVP